VGISKKSHRANLTKRTRRTAPQAAAWLAAALAVACAAVPPDAPPLVPEEAQVAAATVVAVATVPPPPIVEPSPEDLWLAELTVEEKIGQLLMPRLPWGTTAVDERVRRLFEEVPVGGVILFADSAVSAQQVRALTEGLQALADRPLFVAADEEGGRVSRFGRLFRERVPPAFEIGSLGDPEEAYSAARLVGSQLAGLGINMNFAPVADIWSNPANAVIGNRAFGREAGPVADMVEAAVRGFAGEGIMSVIKHFPGHGDTAEDSHYMLAFHHHGRDRFDSAELVPFARGITAGADGVMIGHIATPAMPGATAFLDWMEPWVEAGTLPATFSDFWLGEVLRGEMGFEGLIITDALEMRALTDSFSCEQIALGAFLAGADILLMPTDTVRARDALLEGLRSGLFDEERLDESLRRIFRAKTALAERR